jgi:putative membrane protein
MTVNDQPLGSSPPSARRQEAQDGSELLGPLPTRPTAARRPCSNTAVNDEGRGADDGRGGSPEPDYRFSLANERTLLAWVRTALALDVAGLAVIRFAPPLAMPGGRELVGVVLIVLGALTAGTGYQRMRGVDRAIRAGAALPPSPIPATLALALAALSIVVVVLVLADRLGG